MKRIILNVFAISFLAASSGVAFAFVESNPTQNQTSEPLAHRYSDKHGDNKHNRRQAKYRSSSSEKHDSDKHHKRMHRRNVPENYDYQDNCHVKRYKNKHVILKCDRPLYNNRKNRQRLAARHHDDDHHAKRRRRSGDRYVYNIDHDERRVKRVKNVRNKTVYRTVNNSYETPARNTNDEAPYNSADYDDYEASEQRVRPVSTGDRYQCIDTTAYDRVNGHPGSYYNPVY